MFGQNARRPAEEKWAETMRAAIAGDEAAYRRLLTDIGRSVRVMARGALSRACVGDADVEDIVQETLVGAFAGLAKFNRESSVKTWLSRILTRQAARAWNRSKRSRMTARLDEMAESSGNDTGLSVGSPATATDSKIDIGQVLQKLNIEHREILVLREMQLPKRSTSHAEQ